MELVGYLVYTLLKAASDEIEAGQTGSKAIRAAAMCAINSIVNMLTANNGRDTLAFLLPGIVSGLGQAILAAGQPLLSVRLHFLPSHVIHQNLPCTPAPAARASHCRDRYEVSGLSAACCIDNLLPKSAGSDKGSRRSTGAAASTQALTAAIRALVSLLCAVLCDEDNPSGYEPANGPASERDEATNALAALQRMQLQMDSKGVEVVGSGERVRPTCRIIC